LWQGHAFHTHTDAEGCSVQTCDDAEVGVVPIYGGISWTEHPITQIWYPSNAYHDRKGVLTGAYNFSENAADFGHMPVADRLREARAGAALFGKRFAEGLGRGVAIAWQNMAHIKGGWAQWNNVKGSVHHYNHIIQGTGVDGASKPCFFIVGDQVSSLPGWQEGAIASALNAISRLARPDRVLPYLSALPDTKLMVEGL
jgi:monoamine oxidase